MYTLFARLLFTLLLFSGTLAHGQVSYNIATGTGDTPAGLNTDAFATTAGWTRMPAPTGNNVSTNGWTGALTLPFPFDFYGNPVTDIRASFNGVYTFGAAAPAAVPANNNTTLPTNSIPDNSIAAFWDRFTPNPPTNSNDEIWYRVFGTAPNRQLWIRTWSFEYGGGSFAYMGIVLEESSNRVYVFHDYTTSHSNWSASIGLQQNATTGISAPGTPNIQPTTGTSSPLTDNEWWEFTPFIRSPQDAKLNFVVNPAAQNCLGGGQQPLEVELENAGTAPFAANFPITAEITAPNNTVQTISTTVNATATPFTPGQTQNVVVGNFQATQFGVYNYVIYTALPGDPNGLGDTLRGSFTRQPNVLSVANDFTNYSGTGPIQNWEEGTGTPPQPNFPGFSSWNDVTSNVWRNALQSGDAAFVNMSFTGEDEWLISPKFAVSNNTVIEFDVTHFNSTGSTAPGNVHTDDSLSVFVSTDCGQTFQHVQTFDATYANANWGGGAWATERVNLGAFAGQEVHVGIYASTGNQSTSPNYYFVLDNILNYNLSAQDAGVVGFVTPNANSCIAERGNPVEVVIENNGTAPFAANFDVFVDVLDRAGNLVATLTQNVDATSTPFAPGNTRNVTVGAFDALLPGSYTLRAYTSLPNDGNNINDTLRTTVVRQAALPLPFQYGFTGFTGANLPGDWEERNDPPPAPTSNGSSWDDASATQTNQLGSGDAARCRVSGTGEEEWMITPKIKLSNNAQFAFDVALMVGSTASSASGAADTDDSLAIYISTDCGQTFQLVQAYDATYANANWNNTYTTETINLSAYAGQEVRFGIYASSGSASTSPSFNYVVDNINISSLAANDHSVVALDEPATGREFYAGAPGANTNVSMVFYNHGSQSNSRTVDISYRVNGGAWTAPQAYTTTAGPNSYDTVTFNTPANFLGGGLFAVDLALNIPGDGDPSNDTLYNQPVFSVPNPALTLGGAGITETFENATPGEYTDPFSFALDGLNAWDHDNVQNHRARTAFIGAVGSQSLTLDGQSTAQHEGYAQYAVNLSNYSQMDSSVMLDFVYMDHGDETAFGASARRDCVWVRGSETDPWIPIFDLDPGSTTNGDTNQVNRINLTLELAFNGQRFSETTMLRFGQEDRGGTATSATGVDGISFDNVRLYTEPPRLDVSVRGLVSPSRSGCLSGGQDTIRVVVTNTGTGSVPAGASFPVKVRVFDPSGGNSIRTATLTGPLSIGESDTVQVGFVNMTTLFGEWVFEAFTEYGPDVDNSNDTLRASRTNSPTISSFPYREDFNDDQGFWYADNDTNGSWVHGAGTKAVVNARPAQGDYWMNGGLNGDYNQNERSYLYSPCFDFTNLDRPAIVFDLMWEANDDRDGMVLQSSIDGGQTWQVVGSNLNNNPNWNWYNTDDISEEPGGQELGWSGDFPSGFSPPYRPNDWVIARQPMFTLGGEANVRFRFAFASGTFTPDEGFGIDNMLIYDVDSFFFDPKVYNICGGDSVQVTGPAGWPNYLWNTGDTSQTTTFDRAALYSLTVSDTNFMQVTDTVRVNVSTPQFDISPLFRQVCPDSVISVDASGVGITSYQWSDGVTGQPQRSFTQEGSYTVTLTDTAGCPRSQTLVVDHLFQPDPQLGNDTTFCAGDVMLLDAGEAPSNTRYDWSNGITTRKMAITAGGTYRVNVTTPNGCTGSDTITFNTLPSPTVNLGNDIYSCTNLNVTLDAQNPGAQYLWSTGSSRQRINVTTPGEYWVEVSLLNGCRDVDSIRVGVSPTPFANLGPDRETCGEVTLDAGSGAKQYLWSTGDTTPSIVAKRSGDYVVNVVDFFDCIAKDTVEVTIKPKPVAAISTQDTVPAKQNIQLVDASFPIPDRWDWTITKGQQVVKHVTQNVTETFDSAGLYEVQLIAAIGECQDTVTRSIYVDGVTSLEENLEVVHLAVYPNPVRDQVQIVGQFTNRGATSLQLRDVQGRLLKTVDLGSLSELDTALDMSGLADGTYLLDVIHNQQHQPVRLIKMGR